MEIIVADRRKGKTHSLILWLLEGDRLRDHPGWSRVLVTADRRRQEFLRREVEFQARIRAVQDGSVKQDDWPRLRAAVWCLSDMYTLARATESFEYAVDDADYLLETLLFKEGAPHPPTIITMNGKAWAPAKRD